MVAVGRQVVQVTWGLSFPQFLVVRLLLRVPGKPTAGKTTAALTSDVCNPCHLLHQTWIELGISRGENTVGRVDSSLCNTLRTTDDTCNLFATTRANVSIVLKLL
jgi:hypothetical protein